MLFRSESLTGIRVVKAFAQEDLENDKFTRRNAELRESGIAVDSRWYTIFGSMTFFTALGQLINWTVQVAQPGYDRNDWNKPGRLEDFLPMFARWSFDWLDVPELLRRSDVIFEYPMVDRDPIDRWTYGRVTLLGDAAHPMYPRGSNGAAQAILDARALADRLAAEDDPVAALQAYEAARSEPTARVVRTNREHPPDYLIRRVEELVGDVPFDDLDRYITRPELQQLSENYKRIAGFSRDDVAR